MLRLKPEVRLHLTAWDWLYLVVAGMMKATLSFSRELIGYT